MDPGEKQSPFPRALRILRRADYAQIQRTGARTHTKNFLLVSRPAQSGHARLGIAVSRKVGNAVKRNRLRRLIREVFRHQATRLEAADIVVIAKPTASILNESLRTIEHELAPGLIQAAGRAKRGRSSRKQQG